MNCLLEKEEFQIIRCPECKGHLVPYSNNINCTNCNITFPVIDNIPIFSNTDAYYGEIKKENMQNLITESNTIGYKEALKNYINDPWVINYILNEGRAKWHELLELNDDKFILDIGCGWGTNSIPISKRSKRVYSLDATYERVKFVQIRVNQEHIKNITPIMASAVKLPFDSNCFDVVAFNGVLEWLGAIDQNVEPIVFQIKALEGAYKILKPGGIIYIGIENRLNLKYFLGEPDDHSSLRFTSLMPRKIANIYCSIIKGEKYYMHTYTYKKYLKLLNTFGYCNIKTFMPWPIYKNPDFIISLNRKSILSKFAELRQTNISLRKKLFYNLFSAISYIGLCNYFAPSFCFIAYKK